MIRIAEIMALSAVLLSFGCGGGSFTQSPQPSQPPQPQTPSGTAITISPATATAGSTDLTLTVTGSNFAAARHDSSLAVWVMNGSNTFLATTFVSSTQLSAVVPAALLVNPVVAEVFVQTGDPMGDVFTTSNSVNFSVTSKNASAASISPTLVTLGPNGTEQFVATMNGKSADATWEVEERATGGSIDPTGFYTVPAHAGTFHVIATIIADPSKSAAATVTAVAAGFSETGSMSKPRSGHTATLLANGKVLIAGGGVSGIDDTSTELFDSATASFLVTGSMKAARFGATATLLADGRVLFTGGLGQAGGGLDQGGFLPILNTVEIYDPATGTFATTGNMVVPRMSHTATLLDDGRVLITGGIDSHGGGGAAVASAELYDPATGTFTSTGGMHTDRAQHTATPLAGGNVLIVGGWNGHRADAADDPPWDPLFTELYKPISHIFDVSSTMSTTRIGHVAVRLANGRILMLGGVPTLQNIHEQPRDPQYAEIYDPVANAFSALAGLTLSQQGYTATLLANGKVLLVGGENLGTAIRTAKLLDAARGTMDVTGELITARMGHTATLLQDGRVLVTGGTDSNGNVVATAELYK